MQSGRRQLAVRLVVLAALAAAGPCFGASSMTLSVGATILSTSNCKFTNPGPTALPFGSVDPSSTANVTRDALIGLRCAGSAGTAVYSVTSDDGLYETAPGANRMRHATNTSLYMRYSLNTPISGSVPKNSDETLSVTGTIAAIDFQDAGAGDYADTVVLTIAP